MCTERMLNMENSNIGSLMDVTMTKIRDMVDVDTVVGS